MDPGDIRAAVVATPKDVVARVAAPDMDPLGEYFIGRIQAVGGVTRTVCDLLDRAPLESLASNGWLSRNGLRRPRHRMPGPDPSFNSGAAFPSDLRPQLLVTARGMVAYTQSLVPKRPSVALLKGLFHDGLDAFDSLSGNPGHSINGTASDLFRRLESSRCYRRSCFLDADTYIARRLHRSHDGASGHPCDIARDITGSRHQTLSCAAEGTDSVTPDFLGSFDACPRGSRSGIHEIDSNILGASDRSPGDADRCVL